MVLNLEQTDQIIKNTNLVIENATKLDLIVVYITNEFESFLIRIFTGGALEKGSPGAAMDPRIKKINGMRDVHKKLRNLHVVGVI